MKVAYTPFIVAEIGASLNAVLFVSTHETLTLFLSLFGYVFFIVMLVEERRNRSDGSKQSFKNTAHD